MYQSVEVVKGRSDFKDSDVYTDLNSVNEFDGEKEK